MLGRILVTPRSLTKAGLRAVPELRPLEEAGFELIATPAGMTPSDEDLASALPGVRGWLAGVEPITRATLEHADGLEVISRNGTGVDNIDAQAAADRGIRITRAAGANAQGVAELALAAALSCARSLSWSSDSVKRGSWDRWQGREIADLRVGVVGLGAIGATVAGLFRSLGASVVGHDPFTDLDGLDNLPLEELFARSNTVSLHAPPPTDGRALVDERLLSLMPAGSTLVNTARSALVDDAAVLAALESGRLGGYAVDAYDTEPPAPSALLRHPRVLATPHLGGYTGASVSRATSMAVDNLLAHLAPARVPIRHDSGSLP
ncbi:oxidoreductase [Herbiconiux sp. CPCC 205763]|uniref:Oxidoreductase n=1 Tax=Herbiconiux aconitum TaxID=2970913 RepID=A0ABT2GL48_9MICO|nr:NAD(P)-dependent oxidoreductase [Herbiconiux aconitum]MCS5716954.1 oxidoreductase [Herbiconiux aconitum]